MSNRPSDAPNLGSPLMAAMLVAFVGIGGAVVISQFAGSSGGPSKDQAEALERASEKADPFADLNRTTPTPIPIRAKSNGPTGSQTSPAPHAYDSSPDDLLDADAWTNGTTHARKGKALEEAAVAAKKSGDQTTYVAKAVAAREEFTAALDDVRDWELKIRDEYGDGDRKVRLVIKEITAWSKVYRRYRKLATSDN